MRKVATTVGDVELSNVVSVLLSSGLELTALELLHELKLLAREQPADLVRHFDQPPQQEPHSSTTSAAPMALAPLLPGDVQSALAEVLPLIDDDAPPPPVPPRLLDFSATYASVKARDSEIAALRHELHVAHCANEALHKRIDELREPPPSPTALKSSSSNPFDAEEEEAASTCEDRGRAGAGSVSSSASSSAAAAAAAPAALSRLTAIEVRRVNCIVQRYLLAQDYRASAIALAGEVPYLGEIRACERTAGDASERARALRRSLDVEGMASVSLADLYRDRIQPALSALELEDQLAGSEMRVKVLRRQVDGISTQFAAEHRRCCELAEQHAALADDAAPLGAEEVGDILRWEMSRAHDGGATDEVEESGVATTAAEEGRGLAGLEEKVNVKEEDAAEEGVVGDAVVAAATSDGSVAGHVPDLGKLVELLRELMPRVIRSMVITERRMLAPLLVAVCRLQTQQDRRTEAASQLLTLAWRPDAVHRDAIVSTWRGLLRAVGEDRTVEELLPLIFDAAADRFPEQRALAAQLCGESARAMCEEWESGSERSRAALGALHEALLVLSAEREADVVRCAAARALKDSCIALGGDSGAKELPNEHELYLRTQNVLFSFFRCDEQQESLDTATRHFLPGLSRWAEARGWILSNLWGDTLSRCETLVASFGSGSRSRGGPEWSEHVSRSTSETYWRNVESGVTVWERPDSLSGARPELAPLLPLSEDADAAETSGVTGLKASGGGGRSCVFFGQLSSRRSLVLPFEEMMRLQSALALVAKDAVHYITAQRPSGASGGGDFVIYLRSLCSGVKEPAWPALHWLFAPTTGALSRLLLLTARIPNAASKSARKCFGLLAKTFDAMCSAAGESFTLACVHPVCVLVMSSAADIKVCRARVREVCSGSDLESFNSLAAKLRSTAFRCVKNAVSSCFSFPIKSSPTVHSESLFLLSHFPFFSFLKHTFCCTTQHHKCWKQQRRRLSCRRHCRDV